MNETLKVRVTRTNGVVVVDLVGELDAGTAAPVADAVDAAALFGGDVIVVDTSALTFVDSGGRRALDDACRRANAVFVPGQAVDRFDRLLARAPRTRGRGGPTRGHGAPTLAATTGQ
jgi:anti-anti-sigma factor